MTGRSGNLRSEKETVIARPVVESFIEDGWEVYQEVQLTYAGSVADIVAVKHKPNFVWIIEVKKSLTFSVIEQAIGWKPWVNKVSVAVIESRGNQKGRFTARQVLKMFGIGLFEISDRYASDDLYVAQTISAPLDRSCVNTSYYKHLLNLPDEMKTFCEAGSKKGRFTPYKATAVLLIKIVVDNPGITMREAIKKADHHYSSDNSAFGALSMGIDRGWIKGIRKGYEGRRLILFPKLEELSEGEMEAVRRIRILD